MLFFGIFHAKPPVFTIQNPCPKVNPPRVPKQLQISQPSLSAAIKEIEKEIGFEIFSRSRSGIALTKEGVEFTGLNSFSMKRRRIRFLKTQRTAFLKGFLLQFVNTKIYMFGISVSGVC